MVNAIRNGLWYTAFPSDYRWSFNTMITLGMASTGGAEPGEVDRVVRKLVDHVGDDGRWFDEWRAMGDQVRNLAVEAEKAGNIRGAVAHYRRASGYYFAGERFRFPKDEAALSVYRDMLETFKRAAELDDRYTFEFVEIPYEDTALPGFFVPAKTADGGPAPCIVHFNGFDGTKELNWFLGIEEANARGISVLSVDSPGVGESIRFRDIPLRHDYEVAGTACLEFAAKRADVDADRIGIIAPSLGGYYASRSASMEPRFAACVAWGAIWDYHRIWSERIEAAFEKQLPVPGDHLAWSTMTGSPHEALKAIEGFKLDGVVQQMRCPFLCVHGEDDQQVPLSDAQALYDAVGSQDKTLRVFTNEEGGNQHCHIDNLSIARPVIFDWLADRLRARPAPQK
jgi:pimeloyl-ACP methyl ester carboxylesterase